jgi:branched-chain amino acid transport system substrate-binding protein
MIRPFNWLRLFVCVAILAGANASYSKDIVIGEVSPLSGALADTGKEEALGIKIYLDSINDRGGINGKKISVIVKDDGYKVPETVRLVKELVANEDVLALIGGAGSAHQLAVLKSKVLADAGMAEISPLTGSPGLREPFADTKNMFHIRASYPQEAEGIVDQLMALRTDKIAVFSQGDAFGKAGLDGVIEALKKRGKTIVASGTFVANCPVETCLDDAVKTIAAADPSAVIMWSTNKYSAAFVKKIRPISRIAQFMNVSVVNPTAIYTLAGEKMARGIGIAQVMPFPYSSVTPIVKEFQADLKKYGNGAKPSYAELEEYIGAKTLCEAIRRAGANPTREKVYKALETMTDYDVGGFPVHFSPTNHAQSNFVEITVISKDGKLIR